MPEEMMVNSYLSNMPEFKVQAEVRTYTEIAKSFKKQEIFRFEELVARHTE